MNNKKNMLLGSLLAFSVSVSGSPAMAAVPASEAARLGQDLTPFGSVRAGNAAGTIPRVHVVEATLKEDERHIYGKRRFYVDADSWNTLLLDQYDGRGELWRVTFGMAKNYYELPGVRTALDVYHDLQARRYHVVGLDTEEPTTREFTDEVPNLRYYSPSSLRRMSVR